jgi:hypothetical protein
MLVLVVLVVLLLLMLLPLLLPPPQSPTPAVHPRGTKTQTATGASMWEVAIFET